MQPLETDKPFLRVFVWTLIAWVALMTLGLRSTVDEVVSHLSTSAAGRLEQSPRYPCLSYAPFRKPQWRPDIPGLVIPQQVIEADLARIAQVSPCVRVYGTANGMNVVAQIARRLGLRVWLGVWLGSDLSLNAAEMERAQALLNEYPDVIERVIVGSEVLLRGDLTVPELVGYLQRTRQTSPVPVAYADVWEFWLQHAQALASHVDEAVVHILPYWENSPVALPQATDHVFDVWRRVQKTLSPLPVVVGETGWPAAGRQRAGAKPGAQAQQQFVQDVLQRLSECGAGSVAVSVAEFSTCRVNIIEAFNQPWKAASEGVAGSAWGVLDTLDASFTSDLQVFWVLFCVMLFALLLASFGGRLRDGLLISENGGPGVSAASIGAFCVLYAAWLSALLFMPLREWLGLDMTSQAGAIRLFGLLLFCAWGVVETVLLLRQLTHPVSQTPAYPFSLPLSTILREAGLWTVAAYTLLLLNDGRYMDLSWPLLAMPALPWALRVWKVQAPLERSRMALARGGLLAGSAVGIVQVEGWSNGAAVTVALLVLLMAITSVKLESRQ